MGGYSSHTITEFDDMYLYDNVHMRNNNKEIHNMIYHLGYNFINIFEKKKTFQNVYLHVLIGYLNNERMTDKYIEYYNDFMEYLDDVIIEKDIRKYNMKELYKIIENSPDYKEFIDTLEYTVRRSMELSRFLYDDDTKNFYDNLDENEYNIILEYKTNKN